MSKSSSKTPDSTTGRESCFVIMPIADQPNYNPGHFNKVYEDIIKPAVEESGFDPIRADEVKHANLIHLDILSRILEAPIAICDLSSVNGNVMFELGLRQAFNKPVVLIKDDTTRDIFDISPIRYVKYETNLSYRGVIAARQSIADTLKATHSGGEGSGVNSIVSLLGLKAATLPNTQTSPEEARLSLIERLLAEISTDMRELAKRQGNAGISTSDTFKPASFKFRTERGSNTDIYHSDLKNLSTDKLFELLNTNAITTPEIIKQAFTAELARRGISTVIDRSGLQDPDS